MARPYRLQIENCLYHITSRGDDRKKIYLSEHDYEKFLEYLLIAKGRFDFYVYAYCLMGNHYHLFIETSQANLSRIMHYLNTSYTVYYNKKRNKTGHLFQGRYKSVVVDKDSYFLELGRYIHLNPVKAKIVKFPEEYRWSSFRGYINKKGDGIIDKAGIERYHKMQAKEYRDFVLAGADSKINIFESIYAGFILGKDCFIRETLKDLKQQVEREEVSYRYSLRKNILIEDIVDKISKEYNLPEENIYDSKKKPVFAKKLSIYLVKQLTDLPNKDIGERFNISYSAVSKAEGSIRNIMQQDKRLNKEIEGFISHFKG